MAAALSCCPDNLPAAFLATPAPAGFDAVVTTAEEVKDPAHDLPIGIVGSLGICTVLYVLLCLVITGMQKYNTIDTDAPFAVAFQKVCCY